MATNVIKDWNAVITSAQQQLAQIAAERRQLEAAIDRYEPAVNAARQKLAAATAAYDAALAIQITPSIRDVSNAKNAWDADPTNSALKEAYEKTLAAFQASKANRDAAIARADIPLKAAQAESREAFRLFDAETLRALDLEDKRVQLEQDIDYARRQLALQASQTNNANTNTVLGITAPASSSPGNAAVAATATIATVASSNTVVTEAVTANAAATATITGAAPPAQPGSVQSAPLILQDIPQPAAPPSPFLNLEPQGQNILGSPVTAEGISPLAPQIPLLAAVDAPQTPAPFANLDEQLEGLNLFENRVAEPPVDDTVIPLLPGEQLPPQTQPSNTNQGLSSVSEFEAQSQATAQDQANFTAREDWRVRLALAPGATYLYRSSNPGILSPLASTDGIIFPYTPQVNIQYSASYESQAVTHSNYLIQNYRNSSVDSVAITADFTAQDTAEANYLLAVIHFFRSVTKMFYGQDQYPKNGTPPPLVYLYGLGGFQFEAHPLAVTNFQYNLPNDVDYIKTTTTTNAGQQVQTYSTNTEQDARLSGTGANRGGVAPRAKFTSQNADTTSYVPTKISMIINFVPIISRNAISNGFSLTEYGTGKLLQGTRNPNGGFW